jgi:hypothetical protein
MGTRAPIDERPDPEDEVIREHAEEKVTQEQDSRRVPLQLLRHSAGRRSKPTDVSEDWDDIAIPAPPAGYDCWVDVYDGPRGRGYVEHYETTRGAATIRKALNHGPETYREQNWTEVLEVSPQ